MNRYNPFGKEIVNLTASDLSVLKDVSEGWYIEYKREFLSVEGAAKSLSSFANSYGGWIFYGIAENEEKAAGSFVGIDRAKIAKVEEQIQRSISAHVTPKPYFQIKIIHDDKAEIGLSADRGIVAIYVPMGNNAPYLHSSGKIYRRIADASDPVHETDRHFLDLLCQRGKEHKDRFSEFIKKEPEFSKTEQDTSYIKLYFIPDPWNERGIVANLEFDEFAELMKESSVESGGIPFDSFFTTNNGFIARHIFNNKFDQPVLSWRFFYDGISEVTLPLNTSGIRGLHWIERWLKGYEHTSKFIEICKQHQIEVANVVDLSQLYLNLFGIIQRNKLLLERARLSWPVYFKAQLKGLWRRIPFIDSSKLLNTYQQYGIPIIQENQYFSPSGTSPDSCHYLEAAQNETYDRMTTSYIDAAALLALIGTTFGIPPTSWLLDESEGSTLSSLLALGDRVRKVAEHRSAILAASA